MSWTTLFRVVIVVTFVVAVLVALVGWAFGVDPSTLDGLLLAVTGALGVGEASNVGKRATYVSESAEAELH